MSGPSGRTQLAVLTLKTADRFSSRAANHPAHGVNARAPSSYIIHVVPANNSTNGRRTTRCDSLPNNVAAACASQNASGGWS